MFLVDVSPSMGKMREVPSADGDTIEMTNLEWSLQFVKLKIQEMIVQIYNGRKTDQCGVILFGSEDTANIINEQNGGYENVSEYISIGHPNAETLSKLMDLEASTVSGDPIDALIVGIETQAQYLANKRTWTRKMVLLTDGESPIEIEDWEATVSKMNSLDINLAIIGVDFDDDDLPFHEEEKSDIKRINEEFYHKFVDGLDRGIIGNCDFALQEIARPDIKQTKSALTGTILRLGDVDVRPENAIEIAVKTSKCTAIARPKSFKKFAKRRREDLTDSAAMDDKEDIETAAYAQLRMRTEYYIDRNANKDKGDDDDAKDGSVDGTETDGEGEKTHLEKIEKEELVRGFKYGSSYAPCPEGAFPRLPTRKGMEICGFFSRDLFRREQLMSEVTYVWADPAQPLQQVALSAMAKAMIGKRAMGICRWVKQDNGEPRMGVLFPCANNEVACLLWAQVRHPILLDAVPFADDIRNFPFESLSKLYAKSGKEVKEHPYLPTKAHMDAMDRFVDELDLMTAGEEDEDGKPTPWFDTRLSYNPAVHRVKQAQLHAAIVPDLHTHPLPPPHPELTKYFDPPRQMIKNARHAIEECKRVFKAKEVPKKVARTRKDGHVKAYDEDEDMVLLDKPLKPTPSQSASQFVFPSSQRNSQASQQQLAAVKKEESEDSETESETEDEDGDGKAQPNKSALPTPAPEPESDSELSIDAGREPQRIIGTTNPLEDFRKNIARGDVVTKAVEDLGAVIEEVTASMFVTKRLEEMLRCMREMRKVALEEDEIGTWNRFLRNLREACTTGKGDKGFWQLVKNQGRELSLISDVEAANQGGQANVTESEAAEVRDHSLR
ncbi:SPOC domain-like protein [Wolfiporia cocos MD-104 SS10]|uniref:ATP-dependent DNA helicase II subunit 2 n=1 Tax=Wolfiporia cocos (strain MD-104) TaxID=742152 RepID=A0A2H3IUL3_WOLCO|nr:SPOC domain-like protein [Wolfiporia cocos MD-104 SS10]